MADYYPLLAKAVAGLPDSTEEARRAIYERARKALLGQLRKIEPPIPETDIARENVALDEAVARLESEIAAKAAASDVPERQADNVAGNDVSAKPAPVPPPDERPRPPPPKIAMPPRAPAPPPAAKPFSFRAPTAPPTPAAPLAPLEPAMPEPDAPAQETESAPVGDIRPPRPRGETTRPAAPAPAGSGARNTRLWIVGGVVAAVVLLVAGLAFKLRDQGPQGLAKLGQTPPAEQQPQSGKIVERADRPAGAPAPQQPAVGQQPSAASQPPIPVAHRAALLLDAPDTPEKVKTFIGSVVWRLDSVPTGAGRPLGTAIHADVDIPEAKVRMSLDMQKNLDESLPASHTINVNFTILPGSELPGVKQIGALQMRREDASNGEPLAGIPVQITDTAYLIGLARGDLVVRNMDLLKNRAWVDLPLALSNGRIAKFSLEKGPSGARIIADAVSAWEQQK